MDTTSVLVTILVETLSNGYSRNSGSVPTRVGCWRPGMFTNASMAKLLKRSRRSKRSNIFMTFLQDIMHTLPPLKRIKAFNNVFSGGLLRVFLAELQLGGVRPNSCSTGTRS